MQSVMEAPKVPAKRTVPDGTWIQITFTLDAEHYHALRDRAEEEHLTVPGLVREVVAEFLEK